MKTLRSLPLLILACAGLALSGGSAGPAGPALVRTATAASADALPDWEWPVPARLPLEREFEAPAHEYGPGHRGIDIATTEAAQIRAVDDGEVSFAGPVAGRGVLAIAHAGGWKSSYEPVDPQVATGQAVAAGQVVAVLAAAPAHCSTPCLHLGARVDDAYVSPMLLLGAEGAVLLPWDDE